MSRTEHWGMLSQIKEPTGGFCMCLLLLQNGFTNFIKDHDSSPCLLLLFY